MKPTASASTIQNGAKGTAGKLYSMGRRGAEEDAHVVTGTFLINSVPTYVLFDCGATHSFVSTLYIPKLNLQVHTNISDNITLPSGEVVVSRQLYKEVPLLIHNTILPVDLRDLPIEEFDVILGMDWLNRHRATIDCHQKKVSMRGPKGLRVSCRGFVI